MKKKITNRKNNLLRLTKVLMIGALMSLGLKANAQCIASYGYVVDSSESGNVTFTNMSISSSGALYYWNFGDSTSLTTTSLGTFVHLFGRSGSYMVSLKMVTIMDSTLSGSSCTDSLTFIINVIRTEPAGPCAGVVDPTFTYVDSAGYTFFANTPAGSSPVYHWDFGDGTTSSDVGGSIHMYAANGTYLVCLTVRETAGGTDSCQYCNYVTITSVGGTTGACMGIVNPVYTYTDSSGYAVFYNTPTGSSPVYLWNFGDGTTSSAVGNTSHLYTADGTYTVCLTVYETGGGTDSCHYCSEVTIASIPDCHAHFVIVQDSVDLYHYDIYNTSTVFSGASYLWDFGDGTTSTLEYPTHTYTDTNSVMICLTVSSGAICTNTFCDSIINPGRSAGAFTVTVTAPTGINEQASVISSLENYPNPFGTNTTISYSINKNAAVTLAIVDLLGNTIAVVENGNKTSGNYSTTWNSEGVAEGMYLLQLRVNNDISTKKIIITK